MFITMAELRSFSDLHGFKKFAFIMQTIFIIGGIITSIYFLTTL